jgi:hypothetical protein
MTTASLCVLKPSQYSVKQALMNPAGTCALLGALVSAAPEPSALSHNPSLDLALAESRGGGSSTRAREPGAAVRLSSRAS